MAQSVGEVALDIVIGRNNVTSAINNAMNDANNAAASGSSKLKTALGGIGSIAATAGKVAVAGLGAAAAGIGAVGKAAISEYTNYEQLVGGVETLFKDSSDTVVQYANQAYQTAGMSANEYMETVTSFSASLLQSLGGDTAKASEQANQAVVDMSDNANKMGTSIADIQHAYQGFAKQNYTMLDNLKLGYGGTKEEMQRLLEDAEKISGVKYDLSSFSDIVDAIHVVQTEMGITGTTAKVASVTIEGSINSMKASWTNLLTGMVDENQDIGVLVNNFADSVFTVADNLVPRIAQVLDGVSSVIEQLAPKLTAKIPELLNQLLPSLVSGATTLVNTLVQILPGILSALTGILPDLIDGISTIFQGIVAALPELVQTIVAALPQIIPALVTGLVNVAVGLVSALPQIITPLIAALPDIISSIVQALIANLPTLIAGAIQLVIGLVAAIPQIIAALIQAIPSIIEGIANGLVDASYIITEKAGAIFDPLKGIITTAWEAIKLVVTTAMSVISTVISTVWNTIKTVVTTVVNAIRTVITTVWNGIKTTVTTVVNGIKNVISTVWNAIKTTVTNVVNGIRNTVSNVWNGIKNIITTVVNAIKSVISNIFGGIKNTVSTMSNGAKTAATNAWNGIKTGITNASSKIKSAVSNCFDGARDKIKGFAQKAVGWGADFVNGLAKGIKSAAGKVADAAKGVGNKIKEFLHFSRPDKGPLREYEEWMPDFIDGMAKGVDNNKNVLINSVERMANDVKKANALDAVVTRPADALKKLTDSSNVEIRGFEDNDVSNAIKKAASSSTPQLKNVSTAKDTATDTSVSDLVGKMYELMKMLVGEVQSGREITVPVYIGNDLIDEQVSRSNDRKTLRSGGRA